MTEARARQIVLAARPQGRPRLRTLQGEGRIMTSLVFRAGDGLHSSSCEDGRRWRGRVWPSAAHGLLGKYGLGGNDDEIRGTESFGRPHDGGALDVTPAVGRRRDSDVRRREDPAGPRLPIRRDDFPRGAGELPVPVHLDGGAAQRPRRPRRQHPHVEDHRRQVHRPEPLLVGPRGRSPPQPRTSKAADPQGPRRRPGHDPASLHLRDRDQAGRAGPGPGLGAHRPGPAGGEKEFPLRRHALPRRPPEEPVGSGRLGPRCQPDGDEAVVLLPGGLVHRPGFRGDPLRPGRDHERQRP